MMTPELLLPTNTTTPFRGQPGDRVVLPDGVAVEIFARANLPSSYGPLEMVAFKNNLDGKEHVAVVRGAVLGRRGIHVRVHSECLTGDVFGSRKCDCGSQLDAALGAIADMEEGVILYMRQEGRGIGLANKIKAYSLQDQGFDTVEANLHLGFDDDLRDYRVSAAMLHLLGVESVNLFTNNPKKVEGLRTNGVLVENRVPLQIEPNEYNEKYLRTKRRKSGHLLDL
ncbi:MAG: GTP cyclohydrolase II [Bradymonadia bacterium]|jgi:GTP cyclohydrolase II